MNDRMLPQVLVINLIIGLIGPFVFSYNSSLENLVGHIRNNQILIGAGLASAVICYRVFSHEDSANSMTQTKLQEGTEIAKKSEPESPIEGLNDDEISFFYAVHQEKASIVEFHIRQGMNVNITDAWGRTPLIYAIDKNNEIIIKKLIDAGADVNCKNQEISSFWMAFQWGSDTIIKMLVDAGTHIEVPQSLIGHFFVKLIKEKNLSIIKLLLDSGLNINMKEENGLTLLMYACVLDKVDVVNFLIKEGADLNIKSNEGDSAVTFDTNTNEIRKILIEAGADVNSKNHKGITGLIKAASAGNIDTVKMFIDAGAQIDAQGVQGISACSIAIIRERKDILKILMDAGANLNIKSDNGYSLLKEAVIMRNEDMVQMLLDAGAK